MQNETKSIKIINKSNNQLPSYATKGSAGMDLRANIPEGDIWYIEPGRHALIPTGLYIQLPEGYEAQVRPRSGLALRYGVTVLNSPGTIDSDYTGEICIILVNHGINTFAVQNGDRIAQMVIAKCEQLDLVEVETLDETERGEGGFGHTGKN